MERVALQNERSTAIIEDGRIKVTKRVGKWDAFELSGQYLEPHVALFYMELVCIACLSECLQLANVILCSKSLNLN